MDFMEFDDFFAKSVLHQKVEKKQDVWDRFDCETAKQDFITSGGTLIHLIESFTETNGISACSGPAVDCRSPDSSARELRLPCLHTF